MPPLHLPGLKEKGEKTHFWNGLSSAELCSQPRERYVNHFKGFPNGNLKLALKETSLEKRKSN